MSLAVPLSSPIRVMLDLRALQHLPSWSTARNCGKGPLASDVAYSGLMQVFPPLSCFPDRILP